MSKTLFIASTLIVLICLLLLPLNTQESKAEVLVSKTFINSLVKNKYQNQSDNVSAITNEKKIKRKDDNYFGENVTRFEQGGTSVIDDGFIKGKNTGLWIGIKIRCNLLKWNCQ
jgi:hypothetical protein